MNGIDELIKDIIKRNQDIEIRDCIIKEHINNHLTNCIQRLEHFNKTIASLQKKISNIEQNIRKTEIDQSLSRHYEQSRRRK